MLTTSAAGRHWHFDRALGRRTGEEGGFNCPVAVAAAPDGILFVLSRGREVPNTVSDDDCPNRRIGKLTIDEEFIGDYARREFTWPAGIAVAHDGNVYCSDEYQNAIMTFSPDGPFYPHKKFNPDGERLATWGETGSRDGQLDGPAGIGFDADDNVYVADSRNHRVQMFTKGGRFLAAWGSYGSSDGKLSLPWGIAVDSTGDVYVADWGNDRVQKYGPDGAFIMSFGGDGTLSPNPPREGVGLAS